MNQEELNSKIEEIKDKLIAIDRTAENRVYLPCESENAYDVCKFLFEDVAARFVIATGVDAEDCFQVLYHFSYDQLGCMITVKAIIRDRENPAIESITPIVSGAEWIERELYDILGIEVKNHPNMKRLILADDWPEGVYPLRKDAKL